MVTHCSQCLKPLDNPLDQLMGVCQAPLCRGPYFRKRRLEAEEKRKGARRALVDSTLEKWGETIRHAERSIQNVPADLSMLIIAVPCSNRQIVPLPEERRQQFINHLNQLLKIAEQRLAAKENLVHLETEFAHRSGANVAPAPLAVINGCTTCRGFCCGEGGSDAFMTADFITWQLASDPNLTAVALRQRYIECLPSESNEDSCVFHAIDGCCITREMRNNICNEFHCAGLLDVVDAFDATQAFSHVAVATDGTESIRLGVMPAPGFRKEITLPARLEPKFIDNEKIDTEEWPD
jgi:hypothetical protein